MQVQKEVCIWKKYIKVKFYTSVLLKVLRNKQIKSKPLCIYICIGGNFMGAKGLDFKHKEVINITDGRRLGFVQDVNADLTTGMITSIMAPK